MIPFIYLEVEKGMNIPGNLIVTLLFSISLLFLSSSCSRSFDEEMKYLDAQGSEFSIHIDSPVSGTVPSGKNVLIQGTAYNQKPIQQVSVSVNGADFVSAIGTKEWHLEVELNPGRNKIIARAENSDGISKKSDPLILYFLWQKVASFPVTLSHTDTVSFNGSILIIGGKNEGLLDYPYKSLFQFDPQNKALVLLNLLDNGAYSTNAFICNSMLYIIGGLVYSADQEARPILGQYNPFNGDLFSSKTFSYGIGAGANGVIQNKLYIAGGYDDNGIPSKKVLEYNPTTDQWTVKYTLSDAFVHAGFVVYENRLWIFGGKNPETGTFLDRIQVYDPATNEVYTLPENLLKYKRSGMATVLINNRIYLIGGENEDGPLKAVEFFDPVNLTVTEMRPAPFKIAYAAASTQNDKIYLFGGLKETGFASDEVLEYAPLEDDLHP
jgi:N-acetylneuraminic acid mutarotase